MIKTFRYSENAKLSTHFNSAEFRDKCGTTHDYKVSTELIDRLEQLFSALKCSKIIVNSGFRCSVNDRAVGGNGKGQHTLGTAADVVCYNQKGSVISAKIVTCAAQDIGFSGIANISTRYQAVHLDVRTNGIYKGNEVYGTNTVTSDFYAYWGLSKADVYGYSPTVYTVKKNDNLSRISQQLLGNANRYGEIKSLNNLKSDTIFIGQKLSIPQK